MSMYKQETCIQQEMQSKLCFLEITVIWKMYFFGLQIKIMGEWFFALEIVS